MNFTIAAMGSVFNLLETDKLPSSEATLYTSYLRTNAVCLRMYFLIHGNTTSLTVNVIHEGTRQKTVVRCVNHLYLLTRNIQSALNLVMSLENILMLFLLQIFYAEGGKRDGKWRRVFKQLTGGIAQVEIQGKRGDGNSGIIIDDLNIWKCSDFRKWKRDINST